MNAILPSHVLMSVISLFIGAQQWYFSYVYVEIFVCESFTKNFMWKT